MTVTPNGHASPITRALWIAALALALASSSPAAGDEITVKGTTLRGQVLSVTDKGIEFRTDYGTGAVKIAYGDIEALSTDAPSVIIHGIRGETAGRLLGVEDGMLLVGENVESAERIPVETIVDSDTPEEAASFSERIRNRMRFVHASVDAGLSFKDSTTDELDITFAARIERRRRPTRLLAQVNFLLSTERENGESSNKTDNEVRGLVKGEYDLAGPWFLYTAHDYEYDEIDHIAARYIGKAGPGYRIFESDAVRWQVETGMAYVYERLFSERPKEYAGIPFGTEGRLKLPGGAEFIFRGDYLPSLETWTGDYLLRAEATLSLPITRYLAFRASVFETYDQTPDEGSEYNEVKTVLALSWQF